MNNIKIYLFTYESINDDGGGCEQKAFTSKEAALEFYKNEVEEFKSELINTNYDTCNEKGDEIRFYKTGFFKLDHVIMSVKEIDLQDDIHELNSMENFVRSEIENQCKIYGIDTNKNSDLVDNLASAALEDEHLWEDFYADLGAVCQKNEQYKDLKALYWGAPHFM